MFLPRPKASRSVAGVVAGAVTTVAATAVVVAGAATTVGVKNGTPNGKSG
jgi:hypothetical protein